MKSFLFSIVSFICISILHGQDVYPTHWWAGMKNQKLQLMIHEKNIGAGVPQVNISYPGVSVEKVHKVENKNYLFVDLNVGPTAKAGTFKIAIKGQTNTSISYQLKKRREGRGTTFAQGLSSADFIYLLMPDRFSNGDESNDRIPGLKDQTLNRDSMFHRHGGDLQGVINHLDYLQELGVTALWMTPVQENDMPDRTEHGYAPTDHYTVEKRFGGDAAYKKLSDEVHKRGMKLVQDVVYNHIGLNHITVVDQPMKSWLHEWPEFTQTSYKDQPLFDIYASEKDKKITVDGWFTKQMPDLNQSNPYVANFLIQFALWSVEEFGVDAWRIDTYIYNDLKFMNRCNKALLDEYPNIFMFGETWVHGIISQAYFTGNNLKVPFKSNLPGVTDFQCNMYGIVPAMNQPFGWTEGVNKLYSTLAQDIIYQKPMNQVIFLDNHDLSRFFSLVNEDEEKLRSGISWLLTCRGIPQLYYGTEVLMKGYTNPDGLVRGDFPGGWKGDQVNVFKGDGLSSAQMETLRLTQTLGNFRKKSSAIKTGNMMQYVPDDGLYVYFRYDALQTVMVVMNTSTKEKEIDFSKFSERTSGFSSAKSVVDYMTYKTNNKFTIPPNRTWVLELKK